MRQHKTCIFLRQCGTHCIFLLNLSEFHSLEKCLEIYLTQTEEIYTSANERKCKSLAARDDLITLRTQRTSKLAVLGFASYNSD